MKNSARFSFSFVLATSFAVFACSSDGDDEGGDDGSGGGSSGTTSTGGTAGSATGGSATGGSATGGSATGGSATGGSATGGSATGGSATGGSATGGSATGGSSGSATGGTGGMIVCPGTQPMDETECDPEMSPGFLDDPCPYGEFNCICGFGTAWDCTTCPSEAPLNGSPCDSAMNRLCQFGLTYCACDPTTESWECVGP